MSFQNVPSLQVVPHSVGPTTRVLTPTVIDTLMVKCRNCVRVHDKNLSLLRQIVALEQDNKIEDQEILQLQTQLKDTIGHMETLLQIQYNLMSSVSAPQSNGHLLGEVKTSEVAHTKLQTDFRKTNNDISRETCTDILRLSS